MLAQGKRPDSTIVVIGTPPANHTDSVLVDLRNLHSSDPESLVWREFTADGFQDEHDVLCEHCIRLANPAYGDFLAMDVFKTLVKTTREPAYRRSRLCQFVSSNENPFLTSDVWESLADPTPIPDGAEVVLALDGSFSDDASVLLLATVEKSPHFQAYRIWEKPKDQPGWRVPVLQVEQAIRDAAKQYKVVELVADPFRFNRSLQVLSEDGINVNEFPHSPSRLTKATSDLYSSAVNGQMSHTPDDTFTKHVLAATVIESDGGLRIGKQSRRSNAPKVDYAAAAVMAHSRATYLATRKKKSKKAWSF